MSNITTTSKNSSLKIYNIGSDSTKNYSRLGSYAAWFKNDSQLRTLVFSFVNDGWHKNESIHVAPIEADFVYSEEVEQRKEYYTDLALKPFKVPTGEFKPNDDDDLKPVCEVVEVSNSDLIGAYDTMVVGKKPKYRQLDGYRRMLALPIANAIRVKMGREPITEIPVVQFSEELDIKEQLTLCVQENSLNNIGTQPISDLDRLVICRTLIKIGDFTGVSTEAKLKKLFGEQGIGRTIQQKLASIIDLDNEYPMADIFTILSNPDNSGNMKLLDKEIMRKMYKEPKTATDWEPATQEEVVAYFLNPKSLKAEKPKAVTGAVLKEGGKKSGITAFKELLNGASIGDINTTIAKYDENRIMINHAINIIMAGDVENPVFEALMEYAEDYNTQQIANTT